jgi:hypothetical protein
VIRQLAERQNRKAFVVRLEEESLLVQEPVRPGALIAVDPSEKDEVVVAACDFERIELEGPDPLDDRHDAGALGGQRTRRREEMANGEKAPGDRATDRQGLGHAPDAM